MRACQACAVPFRQRERRLEFCLITSSGGHWLFPKGFIDPGDDPADAAVREAYEEAGLRGRIVGQPLGFYQTAKNGERVKVLALLMHVRRSESRWPEDGTRRRCWVTEDEARSLLDNPRLAKLLKAAAARIRSAGLP